jgi:hypothetical protein
MKRVVVAFAEKLQLTLETAFFILDGHFRIDQTQLTWYQVVEKKIEEIQQRNLQMPHQKADLQQHFDKYHAVLLEQQSVIIKDATLFYFRERMAILSTVKCIVAQYNGPLKTIKDDLIGKGLKLNLIKSLHRYLDWKKEFVQFEDVN